MGIIISLHLHIYQIDDDITAEHREHMINTPDIVSRNKRKPYKKDKGSSSSKTAPKSKDAANMEVMMGWMLKQLTQHIDTTINKEMLHVSDRCAEVTRLSCYLVQRAQMLSFRT